MQINITGHHIDVTPALRDYVNEKMKRISRHFDSVISTNVILKIESRAHEAEATVKAPRRSLFANHSADDMYAAIDGLIDKLDRQVRRYKDKLTDHHGASHAERASSLSET
ncbi:MAG TPA: ribosome-associated translation inhibitor RaiA [Xanthomonadales bacterium]|nr:ribosome-associated translation inhibitor RaiA [Xanthomonadales bacterium]